MSTEKKEKRILLVGRSGCGKTTFLESALLATGVIDRLGKVEDGNTVSDYDKMEIEKGFSINTSIVPVEWKDSKINFIDTPGYFDFIGEVNAALRASEAAVILVDAGHGGVDSGMVGIGGLKEKGINLDIAMKLKTILEKKGLAVVMTREEDKGLYENGTKNMKAQDLQNRIEQIRIYEPVLSVSIHQNSYSDPGVKGPQVFYYEDSEGGKELALAIQENMNRKLSIARPRVAKGNRTYYLLKRSPGVINIVECGFLTNPEEAALLQTEKYQRKVAEAVADGIVTYLKKQKENENN